MPQHLAGDEATQWVLAQPTAPVSDESLPTRQFDQEQTSPQSATTSPHGGQTSPAYVPPSYYAPPPPSPVPYQPAQPAGQAEQSPVALGEWLSRGWRLYKENWFTMSLATLLAGILSLVTVGVLAGPLLMGLYRMAFKTMRGERPEVNDLFQWEGRFAQAFLAFLIFALISFGIPGVDRAGALSSFFTFIATPFLTVLLGLTMPSILERRVDVAKALNDISRLIFSRDAFMWWVMGLVFASITVAGFIGCFVGIFMTVPWMVCSGASAYRDLFGFDDPNRTNA
jgi:hypothetical protein